MGPESAVYAATAYLEKFSRRAYLHLLQCHRLGLDAVERWGLEEPVWNDAEHDWAYCHWPESYMLDLVTPLHAGSVRTRRRYKHGAPRRNCASKAPTVSVQVE